MNKIILHIKRFFKMKKILNMIIKNFKIKMIK